MTNLPHHPPSQAPPPSSAVLKTLVERYLAQFLFDNAVFYAERLFAQHRTQDSLQTLATCYVRLDQYNRARQILDRHTESIPATTEEDLSNRSANRYLLGRCCFKLGKLREAEAALVQDPTLRSTGPCECRKAILDGSCQVPFGAAGLHLLGLICSRDNRRDYALEYFVLSLTLDPYLWESYEQLCLLGAKIPSAAFFGHADTDESPSFASIDISAPHILPDLVSDERLSNNELHQLRLEQEDNKQIEPRPVPVPMISSTLGHDLSSMNWATSTNYTHVIPADPAAFQVVRLPPYAMNQPLGNIIAEADFVSPSDAQAVVAGVVAPQPPMRESLGETAIRKPAVRRSSRHSVPPQSENIDHHQDKLSENIPATRARSAQSKGYRADSRKSEGTPEPSRATTNSPSGSADLLKGALDVLKILSIAGNGFMLLSQYKCKEALEVFQQLPPEQYNSGWVLNQVGKAYFEMTKYAQSKSTFEKMRAVDEGRTEGLALFSTNLWHLKKEVDLCYLAQRVVDMDNKSPEAWCVVGNCFSLQKEHDVAIKFFQRALHLDPNYTYAYTLSGHEYVSNEDFEKAVSCYRHAIRTDARHYNAWYGLGTIFYRQEKFELAEYHFRRAIAINPRSSVLYCYLGMVLGAGKKPHDALQMLEYATVLEPGNPQARFQRASVLRAMERFPEALEELKAVRDYAPREASVYFVMGKICKQMGLKEEAMQHFTTALDLDPKDSNMIKSAIDKLDVVEADEEDEL